MNDKDKYYFYLFKGGYEMSNKKYDKLNIYLKELFFDAITCKWQVKKYKSFVNRNYLNYNNCYTVLDTFYLSNYKDKTKGKKGFESFLNKIQKLNRIDCEKIKIKQGLELNFIAEIFNLNNKYFDVTNEKIANFIFDNFETKYTAKTIEGYYYEKRVEIDIK